MTIENLVHTKIISSAIFLVIIGANRGENAKIIQFFVKFKANRSFPVMVIGFPTWCIAHCTCITRPILPMD